MPHDWPHDWPHDMPHPEPGPLTILYEDEQLIAVDKPAGLLVHRSSVAGDIARAAVQVLRDQVGRWVQPVHRLDRATSGVLLFALDRETTRRMNVAFARREVGKVYRAVVRGHPPLQGRIDHPLRRESDADPSPAITDFRRLATVELPVRVDRYPTSRYALLELRPLTGRRHQLRRHLHHRSHPIIGDTVYGKARHNRLFAERVGVRRLWLTCTALEFVHPARARTLHIAAPPSVDFDRLWRALPWCEDLPRSPCGAQDPVRTTDGHLVSLPTRD